jgi:hypothetical protein
LPAPLSDRLRNRCEKPAPGGPRSQRVATPPYSTPLGDDHSQRKFPTPHPRQHVTHQYTKCIVRIPVKWGTDSGACGAASERSDAGYAHDLKVPHISQDFLRFRGSSSIISFPRLVSFVADIPFDVGRDSVPCGAGLRAVGQVSVRCGAGFRSERGTIPVKWGGRISVAPPGVSLPPKLTALVAAATAVPASAFSAARAPSRSPTLALASLHPTAR